MAFPVEPRDVELGILIDGTWVDAVTTGNGVRSKQQPIRLSAGRSNWAKSVDAAQLSWAMDNRDGRWSPRNTSGAYAGMLRKNLPVRYGVKHGTTYLARAASAAQNFDMASAADAAALDITGDIDVRIEFEMEEDLVRVEDGGYRARLAAKGDGVTSGWAFEIFRQTTGSVSLAFKWHDGASAQEYELFDAGVALSELFQQGRAAAQFTLDVSTGEGIFYVGAAIDSISTQAGSAITSAGATAISATAVDLYVGGWASDASDVQAFPGRIYAFQLRDGIDGTVVADPTFEGQTAGASSFSDSSQTWTLGSGGRITNVRWRCHAELAKIPTRWTIDGVDVWAPATAAGLFRRLRRRPPIRSTPRRFIERDTTGEIVQYWPCEDEGGADGRALDLFGAAIGTAALQVSGGEPSPASFRGFLGSLPLPTLDTDVWTATVDSHTADSSGWCFRWHMFVDDDWTGTAVDLIDIRTSTHRFVVQMSDTSTMWVQIQNTSGTPLYTQTAVAMDHIGSYRRFQVGIFDDSSDLGISLLATTENGSDVGGSIDTGTSVTASPGSVTSFIVNPDVIGAEQISIGHITLYGAYTGVTGEEMVEEISSFSGETAAGRIQRLCLEEGIRSRIYGDRAASQVMGPQFPGTFPALLQECADTDLGILHEAAETKAVAYRTRESMVAQGDTFATLTSLQFWYSTFDAQTTDQDYLPNRAVALAGSTVDSATLGTSTEAPAITLAALFTRIDPDGSNDIIDVPYTPTVDATTGELTLIFTGYWTTAATTGAFLRILSAENTANESLSISTGAGSTARPTASIGGDLASVGVSCGTTDLSDGDKFVAAIVIDDGSMWGYLYTDAGSDGLTAEQDITGIGTVDSTDLLLFERPAGGQNSDVGFLDLVGFERALGEAELDIKAAQLFNRNQIGVHALDYAAGEVAASLEPDEDDADIANDWEVSNAQGGVARAVLDDGSALSVSEPEDGGVGRYRQSVTVSAPSTKLQEIADRLLAAGTVDEPRISRLPLAFHHSAWSSETARVTALLESRLGDLVTVDNNLAAWSTAQVAQLIQGWRQETRNFEDYLGLLTTSAAPVRQVNLSTSAGADPLAPVGSPEWEYATSPPTVTNPDPTANGNTVLAVAVGQGTTNAPTITVVPPPGVTASLVMDETSAAMRLRAWTYANDGADKTFGFNGGADNRSACILIPLDGVATSSVAAAGATVGNGPSLTAPAVATTVGDLAIVVAGRRDNSTTPGTMTGWTSIDDDTGDAVNPQGAAWYLVATTTTTSPPSVTWSGSSNEKMMHTIAFTRSA